MTSFAHIGSTFLNSFQHEICSSLKSSINRRNMCIDIANSSGEINIFIFNDAIRAYTKNFRKVVETWNRQNKVVYSQAQTAHKYSL